MKHIIALFLIAFLNTACSAQSPSELKKYTTGFETIESNALSFLDKELDNIRIVGYGEDTHGTAEFTQLAASLMKYLSEKHGFKILVIETGFGEGQYLNDYIQGKRNDLKNILDKHNSTWRYKTKAFHQFMNWLKQYNQNNADKIYLYGCEMQYVIADVNRIKDYLKTVGSNYKLEGFEKHLWQSMTEDEKIAYYNSYAQLKKHFIDNYETFKAKSSPEAFNLIYHHIEILGQFVTAINQNIEQRKHDFRDIYMGENIQWILNFHGQDSKALYWAHNAHVGDWINNGIVDVTGHQLRKIYGESYFNIATDFGTGEFIAYPSDAHQTGNWRLQTFAHDQALENTFSHQLKSMGAPNAFFNIRKTRKNKALLEFLNNPITTMSGAGAQTRQNNTETNDLGNAFDGILYLDKSTRITFTE